MLEPSRVEIRAPLPPPPRWDLGPELYLYSWTMALSAANDDDDPRPVPIDP